MKPCARNRKPIAWLAAGALDARRARELRAHFETCGPCRGYWNEMSRVTEKLAAAETNPRIEVSPTFQQKLTGKLRAAESQSAGTALSAYFGRMVTEWRVAIPATAVLAVMALVLTMSPRRPAVVPPVPVAVPTPISPPLAEFSPTMGNYEMAVGESPDKLDELLAKQDGRPGAPSPTYTASMLKTPGAAD